MEIHTKIKELIADKENFKVENGKVFLKDMFGDWCERVANSLGVIDVRGFKFTMVDVDAAISGNVNPTFKSFVPEETQQKIKEENHKQTVKEIEQVGDIVFGKPLEAEAQKVLNETYKKSLKKERHKPSAQVGGIYAEMPKRTSLRSAEIKLIRKMLADKKKPAAIAKSLNTTLHSVMYVVKKIKAGKKLKFEKP